MSKNMQQIVLFIQPSKDAWRTPFEIGNLFINRFAVDEDAAFEILKIFELGMELGMSSEGMKQKGIDLTFVIDR